ncbi:hypothetical protein NSU_pLA2083 (plasmid) [Novosphingobium pentaromativorans US6-1]|uniref:Uncharacterized protein n=1 Tax=Novosphingobium pentaromativorans US6-1 TaxID=1088721 RepID=G6ELK9_9SPHN|nr:hypothetical protein NSU_pLA2083 [Novosphingobium pentaromativorans US6-1]
MWKFDLYEGYPVKGNSFGVVGDLACRVPRFRHAQSAHRLVSGRELSLLPQSVFTTLDRATVGADQTITGRFSGAINLHGHTLNQSAGLIEPVATEASSHAELGAVRDQTGFHKTPKCNQQFSCQGDYADLGRTLSFSFEPFAIPQRQFTAWLIAKPAPRKFDHQAACSSVSGLADALVAIHTSTGIRTGCQAEKRGEVSSTGKLSAKNLRDQHGRAVRADATQLLKPRSFVRAWEAGIFSRKRFGAGSFDLFDLRIQQCQAFKAARDLLSQVRRQCASVAGPHVVQLGSPVATFQCLHMRYPVKSQQRPDAGNNLGPLADQVAPFPHKASGILLFGGGYGDDPTDAVIPCEIGFENADHRFRVNSVGLSPFAAPRNQETGWVQDIGVNVASTKQPSKPEPVIADLEAKPNGNGSGALCASTILEFPQMPAKCFTISRRKRRQRNFCSSRRQRCNKPRTLAEFNAYIDRRCVGAFGEYRNHGGLSDGRGSTVYRPAQAGIHRIYYDRDLEFGSAEPWNPDATTRVLTILLTSEY